MDLRKFGIEIFELPTTTMNEHGLKRYRCHDRGQEQSGNLSCCVGWRMCALAIRGSATITLEWGSLTSLNDITMRSARVGRIRLATFAPMLPLIVVVVAFLSIGFNARGVFPLFEL